MTKTDNIIIYDGDCPACANLVGHIKNNPHIRNFTFIKSQQFDFESSDPRVDKAEASKHVIYITIDGKVLKGARAVATIMKQMGGLRKLLGILISLPLIKQLAALGYRLFARHRHSISRYLSKD